MTNNNKTFWLICRTLCPCLLRLFNLLRDLKVAGKWRLRAASFCTCGEKYQKRSSAKLTRSSKFAKFLTLTPVISDFKATIKQSLKMTFPLAWTILRRSVSSVLLFKKDE